MNFSFTHLLILCLATISVFFFCSCSILDKPYSRELAKINDKTCADLKKLYGMECIGIGLGLDHTDPDKKVKDLYIRFTCRKIVNQSEARKLILSTLDIFMKNIIDNAKFLEFYAMKEFDETNLNVAIFFLTTDGEQVFDPYIGAVSSFNDIIYYSTDDPEKPLRYKNEIKETLEEARQKASQ